MDGWMDECMNEKMRLPQLSSFCHLLCNSLRDEKVNVLTIEQGTADWHKGRLMSLSSRSSDGSFRMALIIFQHDANWQMIAKYLEGDDYHESKFIIHWFTLVFLF